MSRRSQKEHVSAAGCIGVSRVGIAIARLSRPGRVFRRHMLRSTYGDLWCAGNYVALGCGRQSGWGIGLFRAT
jgi:hypothetical protein